VKTNPVELQIKPAEVSLRGFNLDGFPSHPVSPGVPHALDIAELYVENPNVRGKMMRKTEVFDMPISGVPSNAGNPWLKIAPKSGHFFIEFTDRTDGPIPPMQTERSKLWNS
jgi:hypothetical protein